MKSHFAMLLGVVIYLSLMPAAIAAQSATTHAEIAHLIDAVERSNCEFLRNGSWYDARQAASHLRNKYQLLSATDQIASAEDFISKAASQSSFSGQAYGLRCTGGALVSSAQWLNAGPRQISRCARAGRRDAAHRKRGGPCRFMPSRKNQSSARMRISLCTARTFSVARAIATALFMSA